MGARFWLPEPLSRLVLGNTRGHMHIDIASPMPVKSAGGKEYKYIMDNYSHTVYMQPLQHKSIYLRTQQILVSLNLRGLWQED